MVSVEKAVIARLHKKGVNFEILVDPDKSLEMKRGGEVPIEDVLAAPRVEQEIDVEPFRAQLQTGEVLIRRNGQIGAIPEDEILPTDERL